MTTDLKPDAAALREFAQAILHGDSAHRAWLLAAAECFIDGKPLPTPPAPPADSVSAEWKMLPEDLATHRNDWRAACEIAKKHAHTEADSSYWAHQISTLARVEAILLAASKPGEGAT